MDPPVDADTPVDPTNSARLCKEWKAKFPTILVLGTNDSGKKTLIKQAQVVERDEFPKADVAKYREIIRTNLLNSARAIASYIHTGGIQCLDTTKLAIKILLKESPPDPGEAGPRTSNASLCREKAKAIAHLSKDPVCTKILQNKENLPRLGIMNFAIQFFASALRIGSPDYVPSTAEIVRVKGIASDSSTAEAHIHSSKPPIRLVTLKSRRLMEGKKWLDYFDDVNGLIFCTDVSDYTRVPLGTGKNPIDEAIATFYSVITLPAFRYTPVVLFLNKMDVFRRKLVHEPLNKYFPEYKGGSDTTQAVQFIQARFLAPLRANPKMGPLVQCLTITAINTDNCREMLAQAQVELIDMRLDGTKGSGKETLLKQIQAVYGGFTEEERVGYREIIHQVVIDSVQALVLYTQKTGIQHDESTKAGPPLHCLPSATPQINLFIQRATDAPSAVEYVQPFIEAILQVPSMASDIQGASVDDSLPDTTTSSSDSQTRRSSPGPNDERDDTQTVNTSCSSQLTSEIADAILGFCADPAVESVLSGSAAQLGRFGFSDANLYFLSDIPRIRDADYLPTDEDIIRVQELYADYAPTGIQELYLTMDKHTIRFVALLTCDQQDKWMPYFEGDTMPLSSQDLGVGSRLQQSVALLESIIASPIFRKAVIFLRFNKLDIVLRNVPRDPLEAYFPDYTGGPSPTMATQYIVSRFFQQHLAGRAVHPFFTRLTTLEDAQRQLDTLCDIVSKGRL